MRWVPRITAEHVVIVMHTTHIVCIWITRAAPSGFTVSALRTYQCTRHQIGYGVLFNPTWLRACIADFLSQYTLTHAFVSFVLPDSSVAEGFVAYGSAEPHAHEYAHYMQPHTYFSHVYMYPSEHNSFVFYWYRVAHACILQLQCVSVAGAFNCVSMLPRTSALFCAYKAVHGVVYRRSQLALDMTKYANNVAEYFTRDRVARCVRGFVHDASTPLSVLHDVVVAVGVLKSLEGE